MARFMNSLHNFPFEDQIKVLEDEELLDVWEESHQLESLFDSEDQPHLPSAEYERLIVQELQIRSCRRLGPGRG